VKTVADSDEDELEALTPPPSPIYACETCRRPPPPPVMSLSEQETKSDLMFLFQLLLAGNVDVF